MSPYDIGVGAEYAKPLLLLFHDAFLRLCELSNEIKDITFANLLENDKLANELYTYLNSERPYKINSAKYYIRRGLLLLDIYSDHQIINMCKDIDFRGIHMCCRIFRIDFITGVLSVPGEFDPFSINYVEYQIRDDIFRIKDFIQSH